MECFLRWMDSLDGAVYALRLKWTGRAREAVGTFTAVTIVAALAVLTHYDNVTGLAAALITVLLILLTRLRLRAIVRSSQP